jgi:uncharacterized protein YdeI (YjbR/CyaY-like superfamily)
MPKPNPRLDPFFKNASKWREELQKLRKIVLACPLIEEMKWGQPCYSSESKNIVIIHAFKEYCALLFFKGVLLKDPKRILIQQTENVQSGRQIRFTNLDQIVKLASTLKAYILEAIEVEKSGLKIKKKQTSDFKVPEEFQAKLDELPALKAAFNALTPGRQRGYLHFFSSAKQSQTRAARVEKYTKQILNGKGLDD